MFIKLRCTPCGSSSLLSFEQLCAAWRNAWEVIKDDADESKVPVTVQFTCFCGAENNYKTPMFQHVFRILFDEMVLTNKDRM